MITGMNPRIEAEMLIEPKDFPKYVRVLTIGLNEHIGKKRAITSKAIAKSLKAYKKENFEDATDIKVRTMMKFLRHRGIVPCIASNGKGFWVAQSVDDMIETLQALDDQRQAIAYTMECLREQTEERYNTKIEIIDPSDSCEEDDYKTVFAGCRD